MKRPTSRGGHVRSKDNGEIDPHFFDRADVLINSANEQLGDMEPGKVSASFLYAAARFNAWVSATGHGSGPDMAAMRAETIDYFLKQYRAVLEENLDDYIGNFDRYMPPSN